MNELLKTTLHFLVRGSSLSVLLTSTKFFNLLKLDNGGIGEGSGGMLSSNKAT